VTSHVKETELLLSNRSSCKFELLARAIIYSSLALNIIIK